MDRSSYEYCDLTDAEILEREEEVGWRKGQRILEGAQAHGKGQ